VGYAPNIQGISSRLRAHLAREFSIHLQRQNEICSFLHETESLRAHTLMEIGTAQGGNLFMLARAGQSSFQDGSIGCGR
jgi:hypothetical protein